MAEIYDCCMFFNELDMLETRFHILEDVVDHFVVCEAPETHSGQPKPFHLWENWQRFARWHKKIIYVRTGSLIAHSDNSWERERYHRSQIAQGLTGANSLDWVIVSDVDEIPRPSNVAELRSEVVAQTAKFELAFHYYDLNHRVKQGWSIGASRWGVVWPDPNGADPNKIRTNAFGENIVFPFGGWHFSWMGGSEQILAKHAAFMHSNDPVIRDMPRDPLWVEDAIQAGRDLFNRDGFVIERVPLSNTLPAYILEHADHYREIGWILPS